MKGASASAHLPQRFAFLRSVLCQMVFCLAFAGHISAQTSSGTSLEPQSGTIVLEPGKPVEKAFSGGQTDLYKIELSAGQFFHASVEQLGIFVHLTIFSPQGKEIISSDSANGGFGLEQIATIADTTGFYRLQVSSSDQTAPAGEYKVTVETFQLPTEGDRERISAERTFSEAIVLQSKGSADSVRLAAQKYEEAKPLWMSASDAYEEALTLITVGEIYYYFRDNRKALDSLERALPIWRAVGDHDGEAGTLNDIAATYNNLGDWRKTLDYCGQALPLERAVGDLGLEAETLINIGYAQTRLGEKHEALDYYEQALTISRAIHDRLAESTALNNLGRVNEDLGDYVKALGFYSQALPIQQAKGDLRAEAITLNNIGLSHNYLGEEQEALDYFERALPLRRQAEDRHGEAMTLNNIALVYGNLGQEQKALQYYTLSLAILSELEDRPGKALVLKNIGTVYADLGDLRKALEYLDQALPLYRSQHDPNGEALTLNGIGQVYIKLGEVPHALEYFNEALPLEQAIGSRRQESRTYLNIGRALEAMGDKQEALVNYTTALGLATQIKDPVEEANVVFFLMTYWQEMDKPDLAVFFGKWSVNMIQQVRANISGFDKETQQSFLKLNRKVYRDLADLLITQGRLPEAQQVLDLLKLEEYSEFTQRRGDAGSDTKPVALTPMEEKANREYAQITADMTVIGSEWTQLSAKSPRSADEEKRLAELSDKLTVANKRIQLFFSGLYDSFGKGDQANARVSSIKEEVAGLKEKLSDDAVGVYTVVTDQKCELIFITPAVQVSREVPIGKIALSSKVNDFLSALAHHHSEQEIQAKAQDLYKLLIAPIEKDLRGAHARTIVWSLDDVLRYVPVAALYDGKQYLVERYRNVAITTVSVGNLDHQPQLSNFRGLAMGVSKIYNPEDKLGPLSAVPGELRSVVHSTEDPASHGPVSGAIMLDDAFTETSMESALELHPPLVHIASHYVFQLADDKSYLLLGGKEMGGQGFHFTLADMRDDQRMDFKGIELFTLSGCQTAVGSKDSDGREIDGLGIMAQRKGAKAVMASLWPVDDESVGQLMATFYKQWITAPGMTKSEALQQAQLALLHGADSRYANPYYWAPFILIGNWK